VSIPRLLNVLALALFVVFIATFFTVLVRLSRVGILTERYSQISESPVVSEPTIMTWFDLLGQDKESGCMIFDIRTRIDTHAEPFNKLKTGDTIVLRVENLHIDLRRHYNMIQQFSNPTFDQYVNLDFGELPFEVMDRRDFYPFDGYELSLNLAYHFPGDPATQSTGTWIIPKVAVLKSLTNLIFLNPRYTLIRPETYGFRARIARLRMLQFLTAALILIEILFAIYLLTISDLQELLAKGLGYLVVLYIIRSILVTGAPQFPTMIDYGTLFLICITFFIMLFKFLSGAEEQSLITFPSAWRAIFISGKEEIPDDKNCTGKDDQDNFEDEV
jgi:hypothetical protein